MYMLHKFSLQICNYFLQCIYQAVLDCGLGVYTAAVLWLRGQLVKNEEQPDHRKKYANRFSMQCYCYPSTYVTHPYRMSTCLFLCVNMGFSSTRHELWFKCLILNFRFQLDHLKSIFFCFLMHIKMFVLKEMEACRSFLQ